MATPTSNVEALPTELIDNVFAHVDEQQTIQNSRLVSQQFNNTATPHLITQATVRMTSESLAKFEEFCDRPVLGKSSANVTIILSYYDVNLANDLVHFMEDCDTVLFQHLEILERMSYGRYRRKEEGRLLPGDVEDEELEKRLWEVVNDGQLAKISKEDFDETSATEFQKLAVRIYAMYKQRCDDQEEVRKDNNHIARLCAALSKLTNLQELTFLDDPYHEQEELQAADFEDLGFGRDLLQHFDTVLSPSKWCGTFTTAYTTAPPFEMLGELCSQLGQCGVRPRLIKMDLYAPADLRPMELSADQCVGVRDFVCRAHTLKFMVDGWARKGSLAENNDRPKDEMLALCSITRPYFSAPNLIHLHIRFNDYPRFGEPPNVSLSDILPIEQKWPRLGVLILEYQPATLDDLRVIIASQRRTVTRFKWEYGWLLTGGWNQALEVLRGFEKLRLVEVDYPRGERYGDGNAVDADVPRKMIENYICKRTRANPLRPWEPTNE